MREKLKQTIEQMFSRAPKTQSARELKEEMLQNLLDKYDDLLAEGKSEEEAYAAAIAGIGDVNDLIGGLQPQLATPQAAKSATPEPKQKNPVVLAVAIALYVIAVIPTFLFSGSSGVTLLFVLVAAATAMLIMNRTPVHPMRKALVGVGVALLIMSPAPTILIHSVLGVTLLFLMLGAGVGLIVYGRNAKFDAVLDEPEPACARAVMWGYVALAVIALLFLLGAGISDSVYHNEVTVHGLTGEVIGGADGATDIVYGEEFGQCIEDAVKEGIDENLGDNIESAVEDALTKPGTGVDGTTSATVDSEQRDSDDDHDDKDDDRDDKDDNRAKKDKKAAAASASIMEGAAEIAAGGITDIEIDWVGGSVSVAPYNGDTIAISETANKALTDKQKLRYSVKGNKLSVSYCEDTLYVWDWLDIDRLSMPAKHLTLQLPAGALPELEINAVSASVNVNGVAVDELDVESVSGDVTVTDVSGRKLNVQTTSGKSVVRGADVTKLDLESTSGMINATDSQADEVDVETVSAETKLALNRAPSKLDIETVSGKTTLTLPADMADFSLLTETVSGGVNCGIPSVYQNGRYVVGAGTAKYEFSSVSGDLSIIAG